VCTHKKKEKEREERKRKERKRKERNEKREKEKERKIQGPQEKIKRSAGKDAMMLRTNLQYSIPCAI
jgi:hypothetical protein